MKLKKQIRLKWFVILSFLSLAIVIVIGYSFLSVHFFIRGMDSAAASNMEHVVETYAAALPAEQQEHLNTFSGFQIAKYWGQMPENIRRVFNEPNQTGILLKYREVHWFARPQEMLFLMRIGTGGETYFISSTTTIETVSELISRAAEENDRILLFLSIAIALTLAVIILLLIRKVERPVIALGSWARTLNHSNLVETPPDFFYPELNELAELIRTSLSSVQESLEREYRFLRHSSHELRTPISVIRNNVELIHKLQQSGKLHLETSQNQIVERIDRASRTMKNLTETLLWLSRESEENLPAKEVNLESLINDLIKENIYLINDKDVNLVIGTTSYTVTVPPIPARIVLGNLIRNAFQHTWNGTVHIVQKDDLVEITNDLAGESEEGQNLGFGLGLRLIVQLTQKLGWPYTSQTESDKQIVKLHLTTGTSEGNLRQTKLAG